MIPSPASRDEIVFVATDGATARVRHWRLPVTTRTGNAVHVRYGITPRRMASSWLDIRAAQCLAQRAEWRRFRGGAREGRATPALFCRRLGAEV